MRKIFFIFGLLLCSVLSVEISHAAVFDGENNLYQGIYTDLAIKSHKIARERTSDQLGISEATLQKILGNPNTDDLSKLPFCEEGNKTKEEWLGCRREALRIFSEEEEMAAYEVVLTEEIAAGDRWANGTLSDSSFDIIVDLNVVDVILFGPGATLPNARLPGKVQKHHVRDIADLIDPLKRTPLPPVDGGPGTGGDPGSENPPEENPPGETPPGELVCRDPDALFLFDAPTDGSKTPGDRDNSGGTNVSDPKEDLPDLSGKDDDYKRGDFPDIKEIEPGEVCEGDEVPVFNNMYCVPQFCEDLICIFTEIKPGKTFSLVSRDTPTCIECTVEKAVEVLTTLEKVVEPPQEASNERYSIRKFLGLFGLEQMKVIAIPKQLPFLAYPEEKSEKKVPEGEAKDEEAAEKKKETKISESNSSTDEATVQAPVGKETGKSKNEALAELLNGENCEAVTTQFPQGSAIGAEEIFDLCREYREGKKEKTINTIQYSKPGASSLRQHEADFKARKKFIYDITNHLRQFEGDIQSFTNVINGIQPSEISAIRQCNPNQ